MMDPTSHDFCRGKLRLGDEDFFTNLGWTRRIWARELEDASGFPIYTSMLVFFYPFCKGYEGYGWKECCF